MSIHSQITYPQKFQVHTEDTHKQLDFLYNLVDKLDSQIHQEVLRQACLLKGWNNNNMFILHKNLPQKGYEKFVYKMMHIKDKLYIQTLNKSKRL